MKLPQYTGRYLDSGLTIGTFIAYNVRGAAKGFADVYCRSLLRSCLILEAQGLARKGRSKRGGVAYFRTEPKDG